MQREGRLIVAYYMGLVRIIKFNVFKATFKRRVSFPRRLLNSLLFCVDLLIFLVFRACQVLLLMSWLSLLINGFILLNLKKTLIWWSGMLIFEYNDLVLWNDPQLSVRWRNWGIRKRTSILRPVLSFELQRTFSKDVFTWIMLNKGSREGKEASVPF